MNKEKIISVIVLVVVAGAVAGLGFWGYKAKPAVTNVASVAKVNGVSITQSAYDAQLASVIATLKAQGTDTESADNQTQIRAQVLEDLINNELVAQQVIKAGISASEADIEAQFQILVTQAGDLEKLNAQLTASNLTETQLRANIRTQLEIQAYLLKNIDISSATASDAEAKAFYDTNVKTQADAPAYKDIVEQIKQQIIANKQQALVNTFIASLRESATVEKTI